MKTRLSTNGYRLSKVHWSGVVLFLLILGVFGIVSLTNNDCDERNAVTPTAPIFADSNLTKHTVVDDSSVFAVIEYDYQVSAHPDRVTEWYGQMGNCDEAIRNNRLVCQGEAEPFGIYVVYIDYGDLEVTNYAVELRWDRCGYGDPRTSVE